MPLKGKELKIYIPTIRECAPIKVSQTLLLREGGVPDRGRWETKTYSFDLQYIMVTYHPARWAPLLPEGGETDRFTPSL